MARLCSRSERPHDMARRRLIEIVVKADLAEEERDIQAYSTIQRLVDSQKRTAEYTRDIAEVVLDLTIERVVRKEATPVPQGRLIRPMKEPSTLLLKARGEQLGDPRRGHGDLHPGALERGDLGLRCT